ncbi:MULTISPECIES: PEPxxWA-CTERM sorting domain-containing protein [unclassified Sphingobium]|uniref:PEPxxWA-CTERM sorting domain-containing protein n=1 Tax=unclassified Sphingobium TaxID=2611147 RepID=UPI0022247AB4|nr:MULTISPECIES: PEPxxWA-CTERM sorting domain-containing protein [unclassified Sphingobium]MCW2381662.1 hypothetical protein [Sphingobium sp. B2D3B]MCW2398231.1 hypothetical protein [Sphingobium sp. B2D3C]
MKTMYKLPLVTAALMAGAALAAPSQAAIISFDGLSGSGDPFTSYTQDGFTFANVLGSSVVDTGLGNSAPSVGFGGGTALSLFDLTAGGASFTLDSFDLATVDSNLLYSVTGFAGQVPVFSLLSTFSGDFSTIAGASNLVDRVVFGFVVGGASANIDNIAVNGTNAPPVPEPAVWAMLVIGFGAVGYTLRGRKATMRVSFN